MSDLDDATVAELCRRYDMGTPAGAPAPVFGGLQHRMYRVSTERGDVAVKRLNATILGYPDVRARFRLSERIACAAKSAGVPAVTALPAPFGDGDVLQDIGDDAFLVFPWLDSVPSVLHPPPGRAAMRAGIIGSVLGQLHELRLAFPELNPPKEPADTDRFAAWSDAEAAEWTLLVSRAEELQMPYAREVRTLLPSIGQWIRTSHASRRALLASSETGPAWVVSHGDLDQKNVLWTADGESPDVETPWLIDWESTGYYQPVIEAMCAAVDWSRQATGRLDTAAFSAFVSGYRSASPLTDTEIRLGLQDYCGSLSGWLKYNLQRSTGTVATTPDERSLAVREVVATVGQLREAAASIPELAKDFGGLRQSDCEHMPNMA
jgi:Ser/Thr protein kinase RdoA (MazF antagonist)